MTIVVAIARNCHGYEVDGLSELNLNDGTYAIRDIMREDWKDDDARLRRVLFE